MTKYDRICLKLQTTLKMKEEMSLKPSRLVYKKYNDHKKMHSLLVDTVLDNLDFILYSLIDEHEYDPVKPVAQTQLIAYCFSNDVFLHFLTTCSITNRLKKACEEEKMPIELKERIRDCMLVFCTCF